MTLEGLWKKGCPWHIGEDFLNSLSDAVVVCNPDFKILWANSAAVIGTDCSLAELEGQCCYQLFHGRGQPCRPCPLEEAVRDDCIKQVKITNGQGDNLFIRAYPLQNTGEEAVVLIQIIGQINHSLLEEKLEELQNKNNYYNNLSHELKTPLSLLFSASKLLENRLSEERSLRYLAIIQNNYYRLLRMVNNIMDLTRIETGTYHPELRNQDIVKNMRELAASVEEYIESEGRTFKFQSDIKEKIIAYDSFDLERVILNLISNAVKFSREGDSINLSLTDEGNYITISVLDTGIGIPLDKQELIFERLKQVREDHQGSGLGLAIVKSLVEMHQGKVELESRTGIGSKFTVKLPVRIVSEQIGTPDIDFGTDLLNLEFSDLFQPASRGKVKRHNKSPGRRMSLFD